MPRRFVCLALLIASAFLPALRAAEGAALPPTPWLEVGPSGTSVYSLVFDPDHSGVIFAGVAGGVYRSTDGGASWRQVFSGREDAQVWSLAIASGVLYAESSPYGLYESHDSGDTWQPLLEGITVRGNRVVVDPAHPHTVYVIQDLSLQKTTDGGIHWTSLDAHLPALDPINVAVDGGSPSVVYLATGTPAKTWRSVDGGLTWTAAGPPLNTAFQTLVVDPSTHKAFAGSQAAGLLASTDRGLTWRPVAGFPAGLSVSVLASRGKILYAGTVTPAPESAPRGLFVSLDGGVTWRASHAVLGDRRVLSLAIDPHRAGTALAGLDFLGVLKTTGSGASWTLSSRGMEQQSATRVVRDPAHHGTLYAGTYLTGVWKSVDGSRTWTSLGRLFDRFAINQLALDPQNPRILYAGTQVALLRSRDGGATWSPIAQGLAPFNGAFLIDPGHPFVLYLGTQQGVYRSTDRGATWSGPAAGAECILPLTFTTATDGTVFAGGIDCDGSGNGKILASTDSGATWEDRGGAHLTWPVFVLIPDPQAPSTLYAGSNNLVWRSTDGGRAWQLSSAFGDINRIESMAWFPGPPATLYVGMRGGVFSSIDGGVTWQRAGRSIDDDFLALDLLYDPTDGRLYAATPWGLLTHAAGVP